MRLLLVAIAALICTVVSAEDKVHVQNNVWANWGEAVSGCLVYVYEASDGTTLASMYSDLAGTSKTNPDTTDSNGYYDFYLDPGVYDLNFVHSGWNIDDTWDNFPVGSGAGRVLSVVHLHSPEGCV